MNFSYVNKSRFDLRKGCHAIKWIFSYPTFSGSPIGGTMKRFNLLNKRAP